MESKVISKTEYNRLKVSEARLAQLEANGVDNWMHYGCQCDERGETECIFCTEDEEKYLGLK